MPIPSLASPLNSLKHLWNIFRRAELLTCLHHGCHPASKRRISSAWTRNSDLLAGFAHYSSKPSFNVSSLQRSQFASTEPLLCSEPLYILSLLLVPLRLSAPTFINTTSRETQPKP